MSILDSQDWSGENERIHLNADQLEQLASAYHEWAAAHPRSNRPYMAIVGGTELTPLEMADALRDRDSPWHDAVVGIFEVGISGFAKGPDEALRQRIELLRRETEEFRSDQTRSPALG
ncbi:MAG: hypothetical protein JOZ75_07675 [Candidatus Dormibacteraeota bacterium]|nr:hypothetical protein [Candidatus Dormibacteraeota bacterium]